MSKKKNEVNGVLVYRRWCAGAILSAIFLLAIIAVPVALICYKWLALVVPNGDVISAGPTTIQATGLDLIKYVLKRETPFAGAIQDIINKPTSFPYFHLIFKASMYGMLGFLALIAIFGVIEVFMFIFYALTGRVVNPFAPVKLAWVIFAFTLVYAGLSFALSVLIAKAYEGAGGNQFSFLQFILGSLPFIGKHTDGVFLINFWWPVYYTFIALFAAIVLSIIYVAAFKDKFYIGRAKRFGSGEQQVVINQQAAPVSPVYYPAGGGTQIITTPAPQPTVMPSGQQPQVIVVNSTPANAPVMGQPQPVVQVIGPSGQPQPVQPQPQPVQEAGEVPAQALTVLPQDIKSIGGHAYSKNLDLKYADVPAGIKELGAGAFANCLNLEVVSIPKSVKRIRKNCFFNCTKLARINYGGTKSEWRYIVRGANWLDRAGTRTVICSDGAIIVDPHR